MKKIFILCLVGLILGMGVAHISAAPLPTPPLFFQEMAAEVLWFKTIPANEIAPARTILEGRGHNDLIVINLPAYHLYYFPLSQSGMKWQFDLAIGAPHTPSPIGHFEIEELEINPWWTLGNRKAPGGARWNPLGYRWVGPRIFWPNGARWNSGLHGNTHEEGLEDDSIRKAESLSCVRMINADIENKLYPDLPDPKTVKWFAHYRYSTIEVWETENWIDIAVYPDVYGLDNKRFEKIAYAMERAKQKGFTIIWSLDMSQIASVDSQAGHYHKKTIRIAEKQLPLKTKPERLTFPKGILKQ